MAFSKAKLYQEDEQIQAYYCKAFSHPARLRIIKQLCQNGPMSVEDLIRSHPISDPAFSEHLKVLRTLALISFHESYPHIIYSSVEENLLTAEKILTFFFQQIKR